MLKSTPLINLDTLIDEGAVTIRDTVSLMLLFTWLYFRNGNLICTYCPQHALIKYFPQSTLRWPQYKLKIVYMLD